PKPDAVSPLMAIPHSAAELKDRIPLTHESDIVSAVTYQSIMTLTTAGTRIADSLPQYTERIRNYVAGAQHRDIRIVECITDAKGDRSRPPGKQDDPDAYTHVVDRRKGRGRHPGREAAHHRRIAQPRVDDDSDEGDEAGRRVIRDRVRSAGQFAGRQ